MKIAIVFREKTIPGGGNFDHHFYILDEYYKMAIENGIELVGIMTGLDCEEICAACDGLILPGSAKAIDPKYYGGKPMDPPLAVDEYGLEAKIIGTFVKQGKPIFGICHGLQALNIFFGGDIAKINYDPHQDEEKYHAITVEKDSFVYDVFQSEDVNVNSYHHWAINKLAPNFRIVARNKADGVIEAVEDRERGVFATQWHPEQSFRRGDAIEKLFFKNFIAHCSSLSKTK